MRIIFIRHGEPDYSIDSLTEKGRREAELVGERFKNITADAVFCSPSHLHARPLCMLYPPTAPRRPLPPVSAAQIIKFTSSFLPRSALCNGEQRGADHFLLFNRIRKGVSFDCTGPAGIRKRARNADRGTFPRGCSRRL